MRPFLIATLFLVTPLLGCGPLPSPGVFQGSIGELPISADASGLVFISSDPSYTSSDVYFYNFVTGQLSIIANGESGDILAKWVDHRLWLFNRSTGRVSYSQLSPKIGAESRSVERRTAIAQAGDPSDFVALPDGRLALGMGAVHKVVYGDFVTGDASPVDLGVVDTGDSLVPFRPGLLVANNNELWVFQQQLAEDWKATGAGRVFISRNNAAGQWSWVDQNPLVPDIQGIVLAISNPVTNFKCDSKSCLIAGACYPSMGPACVGGVDQFDGISKTVRHLTDLPNGYESAGAIRDGFSSDSYIACLKSSTKTNAEIVSISLSDGLIQKSWDASASYCAPFQVDLSGKRIFVMKLTNSGSELHVLNSDLNSGIILKLPFFVTGMEMINE